MKARPDGTLFDPAVDARLGIVAVRLFIEQICVSQNIPEMEYERLNRHLNSIADRLQTADALEMLLRAEKTENASLIIAAVTAHEELRTNCGKESHAWAKQGLGAVLMGIERKAKP